MDSNRFKRRDYSNVPVQRPKLTPQIVDGIDQTSVNPIPNPIAELQNNNFDDTARSTTEPEGHHISDQSANRNFFSDAPKPVWSKPKSLSAVTNAETVPASTTVNINVSLPKIHAPKVRIPKIHISRRLMLIIAILFLGVAVIVGTIFVAKHFFIHPKPVVSMAAGVGQLALASPTFKPVIPSAKPQLAQAGKGGASFDGTKNSYSYEDDISGTPFVVSQQPLPSASSNPQSIINKIAASLGAKLSFKLPNGTTGYIATSSQSQNQTIVFTMNSVLIFIQSAFNHPVQQWQQYIATLQ